MFSSSTSSFASYAITDRGSAASAADSESIAARIGLLKDVDVEIDEDEEDEEEVVDEDVANDDSSNRTTCASRGAIIGAELVTIG
jgi:hypothetical protein